MAPSKVAKTPAKVPATTSTRGRPATAKTRSARGRSTTARSARGRPPKGRVAPSKGRATTAKGRPQKGRPVSLSGRSQTSTTTSDSSLSDRPEICSKCGQEIPAEDTSKSSVRGQRSDARGESRRSKAVSEPPTSTKTKISKTKGAATISKRESNSSEKETPKRRGRPPKTPTSAKPKINSKPAQVVTNSDRESTSSEKEAPKRRGRPPKNAAVYHKPSSFTSVKATPLPATTAPQAASGVALRSGKHISNQKSQRQSTGNQQSERKGRGRPPTIKANA